MNTGKSYVAVVDVDEAVNFSTGTLDGVDLTKKDSATTESNVQEENAKDGETLGLTTDDLTANAKGSADSGNG